MNLKQTAVILGAAAGAYGVWRSLAQRRNSATAKGRRIVILGSGFGGIYCATRLAHLLPRADDAEITLVDQRNYLLFTPMLPEIAGGQVDPLDIVRPPRTISRRVRFLQSRVTGIDLHTRTVTLDIAGETRNVTADALVIALGSVTNFHHVPGVEEHALTMKSLEDAEKIRNRAIEMLERASAAQDPNRQREALTFVVAGGGFTGVETMAALNDFLRDAVRAYPELDSRDVKTYLIEPGERLLSELEPELAGYAMRKLQEHGVEVRLKTKLHSASDTAVEIEGGERIAAQTLIWAAGVKPSPVIETLACARGNHGGIVVDENCAVPGFPGVWALGDCAEVPHLGGQGSYGPTAQNATREGEHVAENILATFSGRLQQPFHHKTIGELALVGKHAGVASIYGVHFSGVSAWALWRLVYLSKMPGWSQRTRVLLDWGLDFLFGRNIAAVPVEAHQARPTSAPSRV